MGTRGFAGQLKRCTNQKLFKNLWSNGVSKRSTEFKKSIKSIPERAVSQVTSTHCTLASNIRHQRLIAKYIIYYTTLRRYTAVMGEVPVLFGDRLAQH